LSFYRCFTFHILVFHSISNNLSLDEAITVAQNHPLWRLMSAFGATHPYWCMPHKKKKKKKIAFLST